MTVIPGAPSHARASDYCLSGRHGTAAAWQQAIGQTCLHKINQTSSGHHDHVEPAMSVKSHSFYVRTRHCFEKHVFQSFNVEEKSADIKATPEIPTAGKHVLLFFVAFQHLPLQQLETQYITRC